MGASAGAIKAGRAFVEIFADDNTAKGLEKAQRRLRFFSRQVVGIGKQMAAFSAASMAPIAASVRIFASFSDEMAKVKAVSGAAGAEFDALTAKARKLGRTTSFSSKEVAGGMVELARAGFSPGEIDSAIDGLLDLAKATDTELPRAAEIAANALRTFNMEAGQTGRVADILVMTANSSSQGIEDIGEALKQVGGQAAAANIPLEEVAAMLAVLANNGIKGSLAGNALARMMKNVSSDQNVIKLLDDLNIKTKDASHNLRPLSTILEELGRKTKDLGSADRMAIFEMLFGRGQAAGLKLADPAAKLGDMMGKINNAENVSRKTANTMGQGLGQAFVDFGNAVSGVAEDIGKILEGDLRKLLKTFAEWANWMAKIITENKEVSVFVFKVVAAVGALGVALVALGTIIYGVSAAVGAAKLALVALQASMAPLLMQFAAIAGAVAILYGLANALGLTGEKSDLAAEKQRALNEQLALTKRHKKELDELEKKEGQDRVSAIEKKIAEQTKRAREAAQRVQRAKQILDVNAKKSEGYWEIRKNTVAGWFGGRSKQGNKTARAKLQFDTAVKISDKEFDQLRTLKERLKKAKELVAEQKKFNSAQAVQARKEAAFDEAARKTGIKDQIAGIRGEIELLTGATTKAEQEMRKFLKKGVRTETAKLLHDVMLERDRIKKQLEKDKKKRESMTGAAATLQDQLRTPQEVLRDELARINNLANTLNPETGKAFLDGDTANRARQEAVKQAMEGVAQQINEAQAGADEFTKNASRLSGVDARSTEGLALVAQNQRSSPQKQMSERLKELVAIEREYKRLLDKIEKNTKKKPKVSKFRR